MHDAGTYALVIYAPQKLSFTAGALSIIDLPPGWYIYAGSALRGLTPRLDRHLRAEKKLHWHIDYLLEHALVKETWYCLSGERLECLWNNAITKLPGALPGPNGFGSSDCKCASHLTRFTRKPSFTLFQKAARGYGWPEVLKKT